MKKSKRKIIIGVSGGIGSFSEEAGFGLCQEEGIKNFKIEYLISVENVLASLDKKKIDFGVFPIENSNGGIVYEAVYAMARHNFKIVKFFDIDVKHNLLVLLGKTTKDIKKIVSHDQALRQCRMYLERKWPKAEIQEYKDTAEAARDLARGLLPSDAAVICHRRCAKLYNLKILAESIQDLKFNFTTFLAVKK